MMQNMTPQLVTPPFSPLQMLPFAARVKGRVCWYAAGVYTLLFSEKVTQHVPALCLRRAEVVLIQKQTKRTSRRQRIILYLNLNHIAHDDIVSIKQILHIKTNDLQQ